MSRKTFKSQPQSDEPRRDHGRHTTPTGAASPNDAQPGHDRRGRGHAFMMLLMCAPMLVLVTFLVISGAADASSFVVAAACMAMMVVMMRGMGRGDDR